MNLFSALSAAVPDQTIAVPTTTPSQHPSVTETNQGSLANPVGPGSGSVRPTSFGTWPVRYQLPKFPRGVQEALDNKVQDIYCSARCGLRTQLVQALFEDISSKYTW